MCVFWGGSPKRRHTHVWCKVLRKRPKASGRAWFSEGCGESPFPCSEEAQIPCERGGPPNANALGQEADEWYRCFYDLPPIAFRRKKQETSLETRKTHQVDFACLDHLVFWVPLVLGRPTRLSTFPFWVPNQPKSPSGRVMVLVGSIRGQNLSHRPLAPSQFR